MKPCSCARPTQIAIVTTCFAPWTPHPEEWRIDFIRENAGKFICWDCGGEVGQSNNYDHVTASTITDRVRQLGLI